MPKSTHTPGPWRVGDNGHTVFGPPNGNPSPLTIAHDLYRPNARLIAAAPEMLEALKDLLSYIGGTGETQDKARALINRIESNS